MERMKSVTIAVATTDRVSVADHLAHSSAFMVLKAEDGQVVSTTTRARETDACGNHASFVEILDGCDAVLCGGIGAGAAESLAAHGIQAVVAAGKYSIEDAVALYLAGKLVTTTERVCLCH
jgi:predicted Fe-Mo cluster-binding NifX family protein